MILRFSNVTLQYGNVALSNNPRYFILPDNREAVRPQCELGYQRWGRNWLHFSFVLMCWWGRWLDDLWDFDDEATQASCANRIPKWVTNGVTNTSAQLEPFLKPPRLTDRQTRSKLNKSYNLIVKARERRENESSTSANRPEYAAIIGCVFVSFVL
jgi:hypothetical protein